MSVLEANLKALKDNFPWYFDKVKGFLEKSTLQGKEMVYTKTGLPNLKISVGDKLYYVHSQYDPYMQAEKWVRGLQVADVDTIVVLGIGMGYHIEKLIELYPHKNKIVIEPDKVIFASLIKTRDIRHILEAQNFLIILEENEKEIVERFKNFLVNDVIENVFFTALPAYLKKYANLWNTLKEEYVEVTKDFEVNLSTVNFFAKKWIKNYFLNCLVIPYTSRIDGFIKKFENIPAVIVGAGPSLNKNISVLKRFYDNVLVIAGGSAVNILERHGIKPHIMVGLDGNEAESVIFNSLMQDDSYFFFTHTIHYEGIRNYSGPKVFFNVLQYRLHLKLLKSLGYENSVEIRVGPSVTNACMDIARKLGCNPVILIGQDLAFTGKKLYAEGAVHQQNIDVGGEAKGIIPIKDIYGEDTYTKRPFLAMRNWFKNYVSENPDRVYFNCTEGGIGIPGVPNRPLAEVLEEYCAKGNKMDISSVLKSCYQAGLSDPAKKLKQLKSFVKEVYESAVELLDLSQERVNYVRELMGKLEKGEVISRTGSEKLVELTKEVESKPLFEDFVSFFVSTNMYITKRVYQQKTSQVTGYFEKQKIIMEGLFLQYSYAHDIISCVMEESFEVLKEVERMCQ